MSQTYLQLYGFRLLSKFFISLYRLKNFTLYTYFENCCFALSSQCHYWSPVLQRFDYTFLPATEICSLQTYGGSYLNVCKPLLDITQNFSLIIAMWWNTKKKSFPSTTFLWRSDISSSYSGSWPAENITLKDYVAMRNWYMHFLPFFPLNFIFQPSCKTYNWTFFSIYSVFVPPSRFASPHPFPAIRLDWNLSYVFQTIKSLV